MEGFQPAARMMAAAAMACRGCAAKLPAAPLAAALGRLHADGAPPSPEDAVPLERTADGQLLLQSVDGFPALLDDPWLNARLTTLHACSDLWACGARLHSLQALVTLPEAAPHLQEEWLLQSLAGVRSVLDPLQVPLLGGHTLEGRDGAGLALALSVTGVVAPRQAWPKGPLQADQVLLLSRSIGTGVLFAAAMAGAAQPAWIETALSTMQQGQAPVVAILAAHGCTACTDITGFGLLGHLGEMLGPGQRVELATANAKALALLDQGASVQLRVPATAAQHQLWIDPQTCGPLLAALPAIQAEAALAALRAAGFPQASLIGRVLPAQG
jgi:selenide,water dikinase